MCCKARVIFHIVKFCRYVIVCATCHVLLSACIKVKKKTLILVLCAWATYDCTVTNPEIHNDQQWLAGFLLGIFMLMEQSYN